jgi:hypothetical protein
MVGNEKYSHNIHRLDNKIFLRNGDKFLIYQLNITDDYIIEGYTQRIPWFIHYGDNVSATKTINTKFLVFVRYCKLRLLVLS